MDELAQLQAEVAALRAENERLRAATAEQQAQMRFLRSQSHTSRMPLSAIIGYSELVIEEFDTLSPDEIIGYIKRASGAAKHQLMLINDLFDLIRIYAGEHHIACEPVDVGKVLLESVERLRRYRHWSKAIVQIDSASSVQPITSDAGKVTMILTSILIELEKCRNNGTFLLSLKPFANPAAGVVVGIEVHDGEAVPGFEKYLRQIFASDDQPELATCADPGLIVAYHHARTIGATIKVQAEKPHLAMTITIPSIVEPSGE